MKPISLIAFTILIASTSIFAMSPPMEVPPAPSISAQDALSSADRYVAETFPDFRSIYCSEMIYDSEMSPSAKKIIWRLRYRKPGNKRIDSSSGSIQWGDTLIYIYEDGSAGHSVAPVIQE